MKKAVVGDWKIGPGEALSFMSGPCVIESEAHCMACAEKLVKIFSSTQTPLIFKASYDKANRSSIDSFRGPGLEEGLRILEKVRNTFNIPVVTDVHTVEQAAMAGDVCDVIQVPAFLCRQTDLLLAAGKTGKLVSVKKGQFMAPWDMEHVVRKVRSTGNENILLVERGASFGYNNLVSDMRSIPLMKKWGVPVCFDASHSVQLPGGQGSSSGGQREFIPLLAKAALVSGASCIFMESHPCPEEAKSDAASVFPMDQLEFLVRELLEIYDLVCRQNERTNCQV